MIRLKYNGLHDMYIGSDGIMYYPAEAHHLVKIGDAKITRSKESHERKMAERYAV